MKQYKLGVLLRIISNYNKRKSITPTSQNITVNNTNYDYTTEFSRGIDYVSESNTNMEKNKKVVRLTESQLKQIVAESVKKALKEWDSDDETAYDMNGNEIHMGDYVIWVDPETGRRTKYEVYDEPSSDMVRLANKYGECEAYPEDCIVIKRSN